MKYLNIRWLLAVVAFFTLGFLMSCGDDVKNASNGADTDNNGTDGDGSDANGDADSDIDGDSDSDADSDAYCGEADVNFTAQTPTVLLLIDQSGSMDAGFPGNRDPMRWDVVKDALIDPTDGIVAQLESDVRFGLSLYTSHGGGSVPDECPELTDVAPALDNFDAIYGEFNPAQMGVDTPTTESLEAASATLQQITDPGPKVIVLATDGDPDTCADNDAHTPETQALAEAAARAAYEDHGILTFVISVGDDTTPAHMQRMANAGQGVPADGPNVPWWPANDATGLIDAFDTIVNGVRSCILDLQGEMVAGKEKSCVVSYREGDVTTPLTFNDDNGWMALSATQIELVGAACEAVKSGAGAASVRCPCGAIVPAE